MRFFICYHCKVSLYIYMIRLIHVASVSIFCTLLIIQEVEAQPQNGIEYSIGGSILHFDYQEFNDSGKLLDREQGFIPGLALGLSNKADQWVFAGDFSYHAGDVPYVGNTNNGIPITTTTRQNIVALGLRAEYSLQSDKGSEYAIYFGTSYHQWERDIRSTTTASGAPVSGLFEIYTWWTGFVGIKSEIYRSGSDSLLFDIRLLQTFNPEIKVFFGNAYDNVKLPLGERWGGRLALPWRYLLDQESSLLIEPYAEYFEFGRSNSAPLTSSGSVVGSVLEPFSQTLNYGLTLGVTRKF